MPTILVTSATGQQGAPTVEYLLARGATVRAMTRDASSPAARRLVSLGAAAVEASFDRPDTLAAALAGVDAVFVNLLPQSATGMVNDARTILAAAAHARVNHVVYTSVLGADWADALHGPERDRYMRPDGFQTVYWAQKSAAEKAVREACGGDGGDGGEGGIPRWTIIRPGAFMSGFLDGPGGGGMRPVPVPGKPGEFCARVALDPDRVRVGLIHPGDIGKVAAEVLMDPERWHGRVVDVAVENVNWRHIVDVLERASGKKIRLEVLSKEEVDKLTATDPYLETQDVWTRKESLADVSQLRAEGIEMRTFDQYLEEHKEDVEKTFNQTA